MLHHQLQIAAITVEIDIQFIGQFELRHCGWPVIIQRIESDDVEEEIVKEEFAKGYTLNGRLLRASMVSVSVPK